MSIVHILVFIWIVISIPIEFSLQFDCLPNGAPIPGVGRDTTAPTSSPESQRFPARCLPPAMPTPRARSRSNPRNSRSPPNPIIISSNGRGYGLQHLKFIRLTPMSNLNRHFELRRYTFREDKRIEVLVKRAVYGPIPSQEKIVLSTSNGDLFAILESMNVFAGIYTYNLNVKRRVRAKINMHSGKITPLTADEIKETPVGSCRIILLYFIVEDMRLNPPTHYSN